MKAPFPWFGGKRRCAHIVWDRFGDPGNYVEPFFGSGAVLLERPHAPRCETVNDKDCYLANFWRAIQHSPEAVAYYADWPVNEADLHARHTWLSNQAEFRERMLTDPDYFDVNIAGWWVWGLSMWIGGGWCSVATQLKGPKLRCGGNFAEHWKKRPIMKRGGVGAQRVRPNMTANGVHSTQKRKPSSARGCGVHRSMPDLGGDAGAYGRGVHACGLEAKQAGLTEYFQKLSERLRRVRVCCGDWRRIMGHSPTTAIGMTAVFLDPPYSELANRDPEIYREDCLQVAHEVREWAIEHGNDPLLRIALCGYEGEHVMPADWTVVAWQTNGGYANQSDRPARQNKSRERIWFSPHCLKPEQQDLFDHAKR